MNATELAENLLKNGGNCSWFKEIAIMLRQQQAEIDSLEGEIFVKDAIRKSYKDALEQIATGSIADESNNYKDTVYVMRQIALDALSILRKAQE